MGAGKTNTGEPEKNNITQGSIFGQLLLFFFPILFGTFFHLFCALGTFFDYFAQIGCFCGSYYTIMIKYRRMCIFTARLLRL